MEPVPLQLAIRINLGFGLRVGEAVDERDLSLYMNIE
jgi:hypothetical protein